MIHILLYKKIPILHFHTCWHVECWQLSKSFFYSFVTYFILKIWCARFLPVFGRVLRIKYLKSLKFSWLTIFKTMFMGNISIYTEKDSQRINFNFIWNSNKPVNLRGCNLLLKVGLQIRVSSATNARFCASEIHLFPSDNIQTSSCFCRG